MSQLITDNTNTKVEIKTEVRDLAHITQAMNRMVKDLSSPTKKPRSSPANMVPSVKPTATCTVGAQAEAEDIIKELENLKKQKALQIEEMLNKPELAELQKFLDEPWPDSIYQKTRSKIGHPGDSEANTFGDSS